MIEISFKTNERLEFNFKNELQFYFLYHTLKGEYDFLQIDKTIRFKIQDEIKSYKISEIIAVKWYESSKSKI